MLAQKTYAPDRQGHAHPRIALRLAVTIQRVIRLDVFACRKLRQMVSI
jgi:hypothetical protein